MVKRRILPVVLFLFLFLLPGGNALGQSRDSEFESLKKELEDLRRTLMEKQKKLEELERRLGTFKEQPVPSPAIPPVASRKAEQAPPALLSHPAGAATLRLIDISLDALFAAGTSTENDRQLQNLQGGGHDPRKRGFTVQNVELSLTGAVDPYLTGEAHIIYFIDPLSGESRLELEEAFFTTQSLPWGLQLKGGHFFTEFGLVNPLHPHQWHWQDQPVINTRLFGPDGMRGPGFRMGWLTPLPWYSQLYFGMQNANGETMASFLANEEFFAERSIGGRPFVDRDASSLKDLVYLVRWENSADWSDETTFKIGFSGLYGPNASGPQGETWIYGADLKVKWRPASHQRGWPFLLWETEIMKRDYKADRFSRPASAEAAEIDIARQTLYDWGFYAQLLYGFTPGWAAGLRLEYAGGRGDGLRVDLDGGTVERVDRNSDPFRDNRWRISPLISWHPSEFSRFRLQYNYDQPNYLSRREAHSIWLGAEFMFGAHAAHKY